MRTPPSLARLALLTIAVGVVGAAGSLVFELLGSTYAVPGVVVLLIVAVSVAAVAAWGRADAGRRRNAYW